MQGMKKLFSALLAGMLLLSVLSGVPFSTSAVDAREDADAFRLSGVSDVTDSNGVRAYRVYAPYTDTYSLSSADTISIAVYENDNELAQGTDSLTVDLTEDTVYTLEIKTEQANAPFSVETQAQNHLVTLPYDVAEPIDTSALPLEGGDSNPLTPAEIHYQKRGGGTYIYCNNPEGIPAEAVGKPFIRTEDLTGDVFFTFEHSNHSGSDIYLGYQLKNDGDSDVYVTVTNIGYQTTGTWLGQKAWYDYYNVEFDLDEDYFPNTMKYDTSYGFIIYTPRVFQPVTYRLPAGAYFYVIGGTSEDAYRNINVDGTADVPVGSVRCANGNVKFSVTGGSVTGTFYAYNDIAQVQLKQEPLGYVTGEYSSQYVGTEDQAGVIDNYVTWTFNDKTAGGSLPVVYTNYYDDNVPSNAEPYAAYNSTAHTVKGTSWVTHLNPQNLHTAVGTDMVTFTCVDDKGNAVVIDNDHADASGRPANTGNWMVTYQDHFTLVNQGDSERVVTLTSTDSGSLAVLARDSVTGEILQADLTARFTNIQPDYKYEVTVAAHSVRQVTLEYVLLANSYGCVTHSATLSRPVKVPNTSEESSGEPGEGSEAASEEPETPDAPAEDASEGKSGSGNLSLALAIAIPALVVCIGAVAAVVYFKKRKGK